jgi:glycosyltransferase involved in cell wall biosynthesis
MDFHGVSPPHLFAGQNRHLQELCQRGTDLIPELHDVFDAHVVHSEYTRQELITNGYNKNSIHKLPLIVDTARFEGAADESLAASLSKLDYLLFIGRVVPQKDVLALLDIFEQVHQQRPQTGLIVVGSQEHAPAYQKQIERAIKRKRLEGHVLFTGQVNDTAVLATLLRHATFLVVTSDWETFCVPVAEAMFFGVPPVVHDIPPLPEVAGTGGVVINKRKVKETAVTILNLLENKAQYQQLSQNAQLRSQTFTDKSLARALQKMLAQTFGASG